MSASLRSRSRKRAMASCAADSTGTGAPPSWSTPLILSSISNGPSSTSARNLSNTTRLVSECASCRWSTNSSRVCPAEPPATWHPTHRVCTTDEIPTTNASSEDSGGPAPRAGAVERFVTCPVTLDSRLMAFTGRPDVNVNCHLPAPSPSAPSNPLSPDSSCCADSVLDDRAGNCTWTLPRESFPLSSTPCTVTVAAASRGLTSRSRLLRPVLLPGLKNGTR